MSPSRTTAVVSPNVAVDVYYVVDALVRNSINRAAAAWPTAGGKGINSARALRALGGVPFCVGLIGGHQGAFVRDELAREGIDAVLLESGVPTRIVASVVESESGRSTVLTSTGESVGAEVVARFVDEATRLGTSAWACLLTGSLPPGMPASTYGEITRVLLERGTRVCVDSEGDALLDSVDSGAWIVKVNHDEFERTCPGTSPADLIDAHPGLDIVVVTAGADGAQVHARGLDPFVVRTPLPRVTSALGAGDTFAAALLNALERGAAIEAAARIASAAAAASTLHVGCGVLDVHDIPGLERATVVRQLVPQPS